MPGPLTPTNCLTPASYKWREQWPPCNQTQGPAGTGHPRRRKRICTTAHVQKNKNRCESCRTQQGLGLVCCGARHEGPAGHPPPPPPGIQKRMWLESIARNHGTRETHIAYTNAVLARRAARTGCCLAGQHRAHPGSARPQGAPVPQLQSPKSPTLCIASACNPPLTQSTLPQPRASSPALSQYPNTSTRNSSSSCAALRAASPLSLPPIRRPADT